MSKNKKKLIKDEEVTKLVKDIDGFYCYYQKGIMSKQELEKAIGNCLRIAWTGGVLENIDESIAKMDLSFKSSSEKIINKELN